MHISDIGFGTTGWQRIEATLHPGETLSRSGPQRYARVPPMLGL